MCLNEPASPNQPAPQQQDQAANLRLFSRQQAQLDLARLGAEVTRLARAAAALHANQASEAARAQANRAQVLRDQASRLRGLMQARTLKHPSTDAGAQG